MTVELLQRPTQQAFQCVPITEAVRAFIAKRGGQDGAVLISGEHTRGPSSLKRTDGMDRRISQKQSGPKEGQQTGQRRSASPRSLAITGAAIGG